MFLTLFHGLNLWSINSVLLRSGDVMDFSLKKSHQMITSIKYRVAGRESSLAVYAMPSLQPTTCQQKR